MPTDITQKDLERAAADQKITSKLESIQSDVQDIKTKLEKNYITHADLDVFKAEIAPYIMAVKGILTLMVSSIVVALIALVLKK